MVKYSISKCRVSHNFKNLSGVETHLRIEKQGKVVVVTLEQKLLSSISRKYIYLVGTALFLFFVHFFKLNDFNVIQYFTAISVVLLLYKFTCLVVHEESLIMIHSLGFQLTSKYFIGQKDTFIPWNQVQSIFINEVIVKHKVIHLLSILTKDQRKEKLIPLFVELEPRLQHLEIICKHLKGAKS